MKLRALAKINLGLDVVRKREDGYHEVKMIMQTINMYDQLEIFVTEEPGIQIASNLHYLPNNENNLACRAAKLLMDEFDIKQGLTIKLDKFIPVAAGMAGGSSDAAAAMVGVNHLFKLKLSAKELMERGVKIGADVPYCIMRGTALAEGIGEKLTKLAPMPKCFILIAKPPISVSTKFVYDNLRANELSHHPDIDGMIADMEQDNLAAMCAKMENVLESVTISEYPVIEEIRQAMLEAGALGARMSGSGPTVFGVFADKQTGMEAKEKIKQSGLARQVFLTTPFNTINK